jgi:plasmid stabilization system protein ParE
LGELYPKQKKLKNVRELIFQGYRIIYLNQPEHVYIVAVMHGSRDLTGMENKPWDVS